MKKLTKEDIVAIITALDDYIAWDDDIDKDVIKLYENILNYFSMELYKMGYTSIISKRYLTKR